VWLGIAALALALACGDGDSGDGLYSAHGVVREVLPDDRQAVIEHDDIEGLMPGMTMNFDVPDPELLAKLAPGQEIDFALRKRGRGYVVVGAEVVGKSGDAAARARSLAAREDRAADFELVDQDGKRVTLAELRGRAVVLDFIFTHCPGPCPILTGIHVSLQRKLPDAVRDRTHFVSISLDPARDTPEALRAYAEARGADLSGWSFLTGSSEQIDAVLKGYGVGKRLPADGEGEIEHTVATFLIDPDGLVAKRYLGLQHEPETMLADLEALLRDDA
jgi:protein SCO1/2